MCSNHVPVLAKEAALPVFVGPDAQHLVSVASASNSESVGVGGSAEPLSVSSKKDQPEISPRTSRSVESSDCLCDPSSASCPLSCKPTRKGHDAAAFESESGARDKNDERTAGAGAENIEIQEVVDAFVKSNNARSPAPFLADGVGVCKDAYLNGGVVKVSVLEEQSGKATTSSAEMRRGAEGSSGSISIAAAAGFSSGDTRSSLPFGGFDAMGRQCNTVTDSRKQQKNGAKVVSSPPGFEGNSRANPLVSARQRQYYMSSDSIVSLDEDLYRYGVSAGLSNLPSVSDLNASYFHKRTDTVSAFDDASSFRPPLYTPLHWDPSAVHCNSRPTRSSQCDEYEQLKFFSDKPSGYPLYPQMIQLGRPPAHAMNRFGAETHVYPGGRTSDSFTRKTHEHQGHSASSLEHRFPSFINGSIETDYSMKPIREVGSQVTLSDWHEPLHPVPSAPSVLMTQRSPASFCHPLHDSSMTNVFGCNDMSVIRQNAPEFVDSLSRAKLRELDTSGSSKTCSAAPTSQQDASEHSHFHGFIDQLNFGPFGEQNLTLGLYETKENEKTRASRKAPVPASSPAAPLATRSERASSLSPNVAVRVITTKSEQFVPKDFTNVLPVCIDGRETLAVIYVGNTKITPHTRICVSPLMPPQSAEVSHQDDSTTTSWARHSVEYPLPRPTDHNGQAKDASFVLPSQIENDAAHFEKETVTNNSTFGKNQEELSLWGKMNKQSRTLVSSDSRALTAPSSQRLSSSACSSESQWLTSLLSNWDAKRDTSTLLPMLRNDAEATLVSSNVTTVSSLSSRRSLFRNLSTPSFLDPSYSSLFTNVGFSSCSTRTNSVQHNAKAAPRLLPSTLVALKQENHHALNGTGASSTATTSRKAYRTHELNDIPSDLDVQRWVSFLSAVRYQPATNKPAPDNAMAPDATHRRTDSLKVPTPSPSPSSSSSCAAAFHNSTNKSLAPSINGVAVFSSLSTDATQSNSASGTRVEEPRFAV